MLSHIFINLNDLFIDYGFWGLFIACLGVFPAEPLMAILGTLMPDQVIKIGIISGLGEMFGAYITYAIGLLLKEDLLIKNIKKNGLFLNITEEGYYKSKKDIMKKGTVFLTLSRFVPWLRIATAVAAGFLRFNLIKFSISVFVGTFGYAFLIGWLGSRFPDAWTKIYGFIDKFNNLLLLAIIAFIVFKIWSFYHKSKKSSEDE
jgi:membrane protein DedA with SNARE-associated domain